MSRIPQRFFGDLTATKLIALLFLCLIVTPPSSAVENSYFFRRNAKWINLAPSGGSLVSGRGNFRPGFYGRGGSSMYLNAFKRSAPPLQNDQLYVETA